MKHSSFWSMSKGFIALATLLYVQASSADQQVVYEENEFYYANYDFPQSSEGPTGDPVQDAFYHANYESPQSAESPTSEPVKDAFYYANHEIKTQLEQAAHDLIEAIKPLPDSKKVELIKTFLDLNFRYERDIDLFKVADYWTTLTEFLRSGAGDCEDWALAMYEMLKLSGANMDKIFIEYRRAILPDGRTEAHMVLVHEDQGRRIVSDNIYRGIRDDSVRKDLQAPVFGFNEDTLRIGTTVAAGVNPQDRLSKWREVRKLSDGLKYSAPSSADESYSDMER